MQTHTSEIPPNHGFTNYRYSELKDGAFNVHPQSLIYQPLTAKNEILRANREYIAA